VDNRERVLALCQILAVAFVRVVRLALQVQIVVEHLIVETEIVDEGYVVCLALAECLHEQHREPKQAPSFLLNHVAILLFGRAYVRVAPVDVQTLPSMQVEHLPYKDLNCFGVPQGMHLGESLEVDVVGRVERLPSSALASELAGKGAGSGGERE